ncbi:hypothetical protein HKCCSP123_06545 [Rhodobacterales bacterium HKCCSP123]|nr:hypothetical protein [Rhodobacterales bacterium HKCCSP123]
MTSRICASLLALLVALPLGPAAAESIDIGGTAQMGLVGTSTPSGEHRMHLIQDLDLTLWFSHTTDFGLTIGVELDLDEMLDGSSNAHPHRRPHIGE